MALAQEACGEADLGFRLALLPGIAEEHSKFPGPQQLLCPPQDCRALHVLWGLLILTDDVGSGGD